MSREKPAGWDRLDDARRPAASGSAISVVAIGDVHAEDLEPLTRHFAKVEQLVLDVPGGDPLPAHRAELNRAVDAATGDWLLVVREREVVDELLALEVAGSVAGGKARGFRIRSVPMYAGRPLALSQGESEIRLFHRRYYLRYANGGEWQQLAIQGTVVRLDGVLHSMTFDSVAAHRQYLRARSVRRSGLGRILVFARWVLMSRVLDPNTIAYLWVEAGFDPVDPAAGMG